VERVVTGGGDSVWVERVGTEGGDSVWVERLVTGGGNSVWVERVGTGGGDSVWVEGVVTGGGDSVWVHVVTGGLLGTCMAGSGTAGGARQLLRVPSAAAVARTSPCDTDTAMHRSSKSMSHKIE
jgi:hypothetical protein